LLLGLFIILYAISNIDTKKYEQMMSAMGSIFGSASTGSFSEGDVMTLTGGEMDFIPTKIDRLRAELSYLVNEHGQRSNVRLEENERGITIHLRGDIMFESGSAVLSKGSEVVLGDLADILREIDNDIRIEGHTDNIPIVSNTYLSNWHLSIERALNTAYYLINKENLSPEQVSVVGYAEYQPIETNDTPEGRASNRRVDIVIIKE
jgi:chemotaxis protein MotB